MYGLPYPFFDPEPPKLFSALDSHFTDILKMHVALLVRGCTVNRAPG